MKALKIYGDKITIHKSKTRREDLILNKLSNEETAGKESWTH